VVADVGMDVDPLEPDAQPVDRRAPQRAAELAGGALPRGQAVAPVTAALARREPDQAADAEGDRDGDQAQITSPA
jgi:hypothetical protein